MLARSLLALCAVGAVTTSAVTTNNRQRKSTFLDIVNKRPSRESSYKSPVLPVQLPIKLGGHGGTNLPVLVWPIPVPLFSKSHSCKDEQDDNIVVSRPGQPQFISPPYVALRHQFDDSEDPTTDRPQGLTPDSGQSPDVYWNNYPSPIIVGQDSPQRESNNDYPAETVKPSFPRRNSVRTESDTNEYLSSPPAVNQKSPKEPVKFHPRTASPKRVIVTRIHKTKKTYPSNPNPREGPRQLQNNNAPILTTPEQPLTTQKYIANVRPTILLGSSPHRVGFTVSEKPSDQAQPENDNESTDKPQQWHQPVENVIPDDLQQPPSSGKLDIEEAEPVIVEDPIPYSKGRHVFDTTDELIERYRREAPTAPWLPAVMPRGRRFPARMPDVDAPEPTKPTARAPPRPRFARSLRLLIDLTVPRSDYTEIYDLVWHADSNTVRTVVEDGNTVFYRVPRLDGRVQFLKVFEDRLNGTLVRRCTTSPLLPASPADEVYPGLPDLSKFHFVGYTSAEGRPQVEHWQHVVVGALGEGGAARGEALNYTHNFYLYRDGWDAVPLRYTVLTHSSVLGPASDSYTHRYRLLPTPTFPIIPDLSECHVVEELKEEDMRQRAASGNIKSTVTSASIEATNSIRRVDTEEASHSQGLFSNIIETVSSSVKEIFNPNEKQQKDKEIQLDALGNVIGTVSSSVQSFLNPGDVIKDNTYIAESGDIFSDVASAARDFFHPIGDFLGLTRPKKYDSMFDDFKNKYQREYRDDREEAVRKAQFVNTNRYVDATNRLASTFFTEINHLADRVDGEIERLCGAILPVLDEFIEEVSPEFSMNDTKKIMESENWPEHFDWRERGYSTEVFHQGENCSSCWACAVAGATEGALFNKTNEVVRLSPQSMVDCGKPDTNGCDPSDPTKGADYVKKNGLSAWNDYQYKQKVGACRKPPNPPIVTRISGYRRVPDNEEALRVAIRNYAPSMVFVPGLSRSFQMFNGDGIIDDQRCSGKPNHTVLAVGWGTQNGTNYFTVKNSWSTDWAKGGYGRIQATSCTITKYAFYMVI